MVVSKFEMFFFIFADVDECLQSLNACRSDLACKNTVGSYRCECPAGFVKEPGAQNLIDPVCVGEEVLAYKELVMKVEYCRAN